MVKKRNVLKYRFLPVPSQNQGFLLLPPRAQPPGPRHPDVRDQGEERGPQALASLTSPAHQRYPESGGHPASPGNAALCLHSRAHRTRVHLPPSGPSLNVSKFLALSLPGPSTTDAGCAVTALEVWPLCPEGTRGRCCPPGPCHPSATHPTTQGTRRVPEPQARTGLASSGCRRIGREPRGGGGGIAVSPSRNS